MNDAMHELTEEEITEKVAEALVELGVKACAQDTGGGINCVVVERVDGGEIYWGTADVNWGAMITDADGQPISSIKTDCSSGSQDPMAIADALFGPSSQKKKKKKKKRRQTSQVTTHCFPAKKKREQRYSEESLCDAGHGPDK